MERGAAIPSPSSASRSSPAWRFTSFRRSFIWTRTTRPVPCAPRSGATGSTSRSSASLTRRSAVGRSDDAACPWASSVPPARRGDRPGCGFYVFASFNGLPVQTLALVDAWAILLAWMICGGGREGLSVDAVAEEAGRRRRCPGGAPARRSFSPGWSSTRQSWAPSSPGVEKVLAGWPGTNEMGILLNYPRGFWSATGSPRRAGFMDPS